MTRRFAFCLSGAALAIVAFALAYDAPLNGAFAQVITADARIVRESTDAEQLRPWLIVGFSGAGFFLALWTYFRQTHKTEFREITHASEIKLSELRDRFDRFAEKIAIRENTHAEKLQTVSDRLRSVEERLQLGPTSDDVQLIALTVRSVEGDIKELAATMRALAKSQDRMDEMMAKGRS